MVPARLLQLFGLACLAAADHSSHLVMTPQNPILEIGTNFTATCTIINTDAVTVDDLYWVLGSTLLPEEDYKKINRTTLSVTFPISMEISGWLMCRSKTTNKVFWPNGKFTQGIMLKTGYRPEKPENLSCIALQEKSSISPFITCKWDVKGRQTVVFPTTYTLIVEYASFHANTSTRETHAKVSLSTYPNFIQLDIWVEARNALGTVVSEPIKVSDANHFVKPNPPSEVKVISEKEFPSSLLTQWEHPLQNSLNLSYRIRYCPRGSHTWTEVPQEDTDSHLESFRLQGLKPYTDYVIQFRCKDSGSDSVYWSDWSTNFTKRTPESKPSSRPDVWRIVVERGVNKRQVKVLSKEPEEANGRITRFDIFLQYNKSVIPAGESIPVTVSEEGSLYDHRNATELKDIFLDDKQSVMVGVTASNLEGTSPQAKMGILYKSSVRTPVKDLKVWSHEGQMYLEWKLADNKNVSEYVIEWIKEVDSESGSTDYGTMWPNWQREAGRTRKTTIKGNLEPFVCYSVCVYPIHSGWIGVPARIQAFLEEGAPLKGPALELKGEPGYNQANLVWKEIPLEMRRGFITNYTIFYKNGDKTNAVTVQNNRTSYTLKSLLGNTRYDVWIQASTVRGACNGTTHSFTTSRYESFEGIVVGVSIGFLFLLLLIILLCIYKREAIKENLWPQIPDPGESTIGTWSPDYPLKADTPKENCVSGISVLDVGDAKHDFEEDKTSLSLKKDKYLSEEHSSGIGGSSCMSSPRQSVSDSDEGADMADTTASTVQYSSVVATSGYKVQTPASLPQHSIFSRSESTQPLLESEENPDMLFQDGGQHFQRFPRQSCFTQPEDLDCGDFQQLDEEQADFCPFEEDTELPAAPESQSADASSSSYMPQLGGYRPQ